MIKTFEEFKNFYEKYGKCINDTFTRKNKLNNVQLQSRYDKYIKAYNKRIKKFSEDNIDLEWVQVREEVFSRDKYRCRFIEILNPDEYQELTKNAGSLIEILDPAHILPRSVYPELKYENLNIVILNRYSHSMLDFDKHPLNGKIISREEVELWWIRIVGEDLIKYLKGLSKFVRGV